MPASYLPLPPAGIKLALRDTSTRAYISLIPPSYLPHISLSRDTISLGMLSPSYPPHISLTLSPSHYLPLPPDTIPLISARVEAERVAQRRARQQRLCRGK